MTSSPGPDIVVRRAEARDADALRAIFASPGAMSGTLQLPFPSAAVWAKRIAEIPGDEFMLVAEVAGEVVGDLGLHAASRSPRRRHAGLIGMSVRDDWQGRGVGSALLAAAVELADRWIGYTRLELMVYTDNPAALALYRKFGFEIEGTARGYAMRDGAYVDAYMMARYRPRETVGGSGARPAAARKHSKAARKRRA